MKTSSIILSAVGGTILLLWVAALVFVARNAADPRIKHKIVVANVGEYSILNLIAREKGYFAKHGLDAQVNEYPTGRESVDALLAGQADFAVGADYVGVTKIMSGADLRFLAQLSGHYVFQVVALRDKGIAAPADLKGKTVGVTRRTAGELHLGKFLDANGLSYDDVTMVDLSPTEMVSRISAGELDAIVIFDPFAYRVERNLADAAIVWSAQAGRKTNAALYATAATLADRPDVVDRYLHALLDAERFLNANDAESRAILARAMGYDAEYVDYLWPQIEFFVQLNDGLRLTLEEQARWLIANRLTEASEVPDFDQYIAIEPLERVEPTAVLLVR